ncbi:MAG: aminoglycoside phosphotransferase family protein [Acidobacteria bacterium]|nr:aminoglycoside phosphotransferase family protein [Acidobacteriota bacterium]
MPEPLAWHPASESVWIGALDGTPLSEDLTADRWQEIGQTLAAFHRIQPPATIPVGPAVSADLRMKIPHLAAVQPELRSRLADLAAKLIGGEPPAREDNATLHGDLHLKNLIALPDGRIGLIDLDNLKQGDPLIDLGSFVAYLYYRRLAAGLPAETAADEIAELSQGYTHGAGQPIDLARLRFRTAVALLTERAWRSLTRLRPDVGAMIENIVDLAERLVMR